MDLLKVNIESAEHLLNTSQPKEAINYIRAAQAILPQTKRDDPVSLATIAGLLIDCGSELNDVSTIQEGLGILESNYDRFATITQKQSLEYNIGNAKKSLHDIYFGTNRSQCNPLAISALIDAKKHYWKAFNLSNEKTLSPMLFVNLGNTLDQSCRIVEALRWYDKAISLDPRFGMAHLNRGIALKFLSTISGTSTITQIYETKQAFELAELCGTLPLHLSEDGKREVNNLNKCLKELGWDETRITKYERQRKVEREQHDLYWRFCLSHYLALNEHALYCQCAGSRRDDLSILKQTGSIGGKFLLVLELLLNRIKSEFCLARALYYESVSDESRWDTKIYEGTFTELCDNEAINIRYELLRTSFRLCFGILDRIASGLNELYKFAEPQEPLHFESFWRNNEKRWNKINQQNNLGLIALYSIATDLNVKDGEWGFCKEYRNLLEHGLLFLIESDSVSLSNNLKPKHVKFKAIPLEIFNIQALHILQMTASAVFSFVFCIREEAQRAKGNAPSIKVCFNKKDIGKK